MTNTFTPAPVANFTEIATSEPFAGCFTPTGTGSILVAVFRFELDTKQSAEVYLHGVSLNGKKTMTGSFPLVNDDKTTMHIFDQKVIVVGP